MKLIKFKKLINYILSKFGFRIVKIKFRFPQKNSTNGIFALGYNKDDLNLNIGSGGESYPFFINLDLPSDHYKERHKKHKFIPYDLSKDKLPYENNTVSNIFCSHVIEHCEDSAVNKLFYECIRVLKKKGVFRITCPDSKFLFDVSSFENEYWHRIKNQKEEWYGRESSSVSNHDCFIGAISTNKLSLDKNTYDKLYSEVKKMDYFDAVRFLTKKNKVNPNSVGNHINYFDFEKIQTMVKDAFSKLHIQNYKIINSKPKGSISQLMSEDCFGEKQHMSIFVDCVKL
jgi:predicted SAM-dependent methyltransferase